MEAKKTPPPAPVAQDLPQPGNSVIFKSDASNSNSLSFSIPHLKPILASLVMLFLVGGVGVGVYLVGQQQQVKSRADENLSENVTSVVPKELVNQSATPSAQASASASIQPLASSSADLSDIQMPDLEVSSTASEEASLGSYDFNDDSLVNSVDLSIMYSGWGVPRNDLQKGADINQDGTINGIDYSLFLPHFKEITN